MNWALGERLAWPLGEQLIDMDKSRQRLKLLDERMVRATMRVTGVNRTTILDIMAFVGDDSERRIAPRLQALLYANVQIDEVWAFVLMKVRTRESFYPAKDVVVDC